MKKNIHTLKKIALFTVITIAALVFVKSFVTERNLKGLETSFSEIYEDRLMTESYIYKMSAVLYKKKILFLSTQQTNMHPEFLVYQKELDELIADYSLTKLTKAERQLFLLFKTKIELLRGVDVTSASANEEKIMHAGIKSCDEAILLLQALSSIQVAEGKLLSDDSKKVLSNSLMTIQLEWLGYIILLIIIFSLLNTRKESDTRNHNHQLN